MSLWQKLRAALDVAQARPARAEGVVARQLRDRAGPYYVIKNPSTRTYLRLSPREFWLWERMDGTRTVQQLVVAFFQEHHSFAFGVIVGLSQQLYLQQMLSERPRFVFADVARSLAERTLSQKLMWPARAVLNREWAIGGLDGWLTRLHRGGAWILFSLPAQILFLLVSVVGLVLFTLLLGDPRFKFLSENIALSLATLGLLANVPLVIHEFGHAITAKHCGCDVHRGGVLLYYGLPAAFVDTSDVWMYGKGARLAVTWAGPYTGFILGGVCAIVIWLWPGLSVASLLFQLAFVSILTSVFNLNPLLKLDGYYLLSDALEIAQLRERSLGFMRHQLLPKLLKRESWSREESLFVAFGTLAAVWTVYFVYLSALIWNTRLTQSVQDLLTGRGSVASLIFNGLLILLAISFLAAAGIQGYQLARTVIARIRRSGILAGPGRAALAIGLGAAALTFGPALVLPGAATFLGLVLGLAAFAWSVRSALAIAGALRGSSYSRAWIIVAGALTAIGLAHLLWHAAQPVPATAAQTLDAAGLALAVLALALGGRLIFGLRESWRAASAIIFGLGCLILICALAAGGNASAHLFGGLLWCGGLIHWRTAPRSSLASPEPLSLAQRDTTQERLWAAFQWLAGSTIGQLRSEYGTGAARDAQSGFNRIAADQGWGMTLTGGQAVDLPAPAIEGETISSASAIHMTAADFADLLAAALAALLDETARIAGESFVRRSLARGYDTLDWEQREISGEYLLARVNWAAELAEQFAQTRGDIADLLARAPLFVDFSAEEIRAVGGHLRAEHFARGEAIIRQGEAGDRFYILRRGRVAVIQRDVHGSDQKLTELVSGDYFGEAALLSGERRNATIRALTPVEALVLHRKDFDRLRRAGLAAHGKVETALRRAGLLRQIPVFADFESFELRRVAAQLESQLVDAGQVIFRQDDPAGKFYIVETGEVTVRLRLPDGQEVEPARLGPGEYFGEIALLMNVPRTATVIATQPTTLLALGAGPFNELLRESRSVSRALERAGTRRLLADRQLSRRSVTE